ncbi:primary-amine oxidase [Leifsonia shinshuensis]|uniref:primary-amine oxidase n=1 Tax=Leifsonia shinshuensis TaxID=150026 RepID=UPI001F505720|nr:primary-amine oxidase [Leifsonia shinshuensis]MCI0158394.1 primary-amine oxidase [Leifsonia shinshuensis]
MSLTIPTTTTTAIHPLAALTPAEIDRAREVLTAAGLVTEHTRFTYVLLHEPHKRDVLDPERAASLRRQVETLLLDFATGAVTQAVVDVTDGVVVGTRELDPATEGTAPVLDEEFALVDEIVKADAGWAAALARRGIHDIENVRTCPLTAGHFDYDDEEGRRMFRVLAFYQGSPSDLPWAHPIDGIVAHVDTLSRSVIRLVETPVETVPMESGDYLDPEVTGPLRTSLKPIEISQPEGVSFSYDDGVLSWENWDLRVGFNGREGLTLHDVAFTHQQERRPILYRASISEMVVNYADPTPIHGWQNYYDAGEYQFGRLANSLELGCDCLGEIFYLDAVVADDFGRPRTIANAICIHEEDYGILWKHTDEFTHTSEARRQRRLVVSFFTTVGNYDYGFYFYFYLDGTFEVEAKATGIVFTGAHDGGDDPYSTPLAPGLGAPVHQHMFCARLDMTVDGVANAVDEIDVARVPVSDANPWGSAIGRTVTRLKTESGAVRDADGSVGRVWSISSAERTNRVGRPTSYVLHPESGPALFSAEEAHQRRRAGFAAHHLWVTQYEPSELWAAGYAVNLHPGGAGLPAYVAQDRPIDGEDIVVWHTFGLTHFPRLEDWPIMPVDYAGFSLKPYGFFDRNPTLDLPRSTSAACHSASGSSAAGSTASGSSASGSSGSACGPECSCGH